MSEQTESASNHDPLCPARSRPAAWEPEMCVCDIITEVEERALRRGEASDHDPLCPTPQCDFGDKGGLGDCAGWGDCHHDCRCRFIAKVRADEREKAVAEVAAFDVQPCDDCDRSCACWRCDVHERVEDIIAALLRGRGQR